jgi:tyrosyl-tRNA synthetase
LKIVLSAAGVVDLYHGPGAGEAAAVRFDRVHRDRDLPAEVQERAIPAAAMTDGAVFLPRLLVEVGFASSNSDARRTVEQGGVRVDGHVVRDVELPVEASAAGRIRRFIRLS